jgi:hypothetical protein
MFFIQLKSVLFFCFFVNSPQEKVKKVKKNLFIQPTRFQAIKKYFKKRIEKGFKNRINALLLHPHCSRRSLNQTEKNGQ